LSLATGFWSAIVAASAHLDDQAELLPMIRAQACTRILPVVRSRGKCDRCLAGAAGGQRRTAATERCRPPWARAAGVDGGLEQVELANSVVGVGVDDDVDEWHPLVLWR
jgi:hypothetical protein